MDDTSIAVLWLVAALGALVGYLVGRPKGRGGLGAMLGFFFSLIGVAIVALMGDADDGRRG